MFAKVKGHVFVFCFVLADVKYVEGKVLNLIGGNVTVSKCCKMIEKKVTDGRAEKTCHLQTPAILRMARCAVAIRFALWEIWRDRLPYWLHVSQGLRRHLTSTTVHFYILPALYTTSL